MAQLELAWQPNDGAQTAFLASTAREVLFGGAAGCSKTESLMVLPLYRAHNPRHRSIVFRRTRKQLQEIIDRQQALYPYVAPGVKWQEDKSRWVWPSGATTRMGYMEHEQDRYKFKSDEFDMVLFDELTSFTEKQYLFMFSRNRTKDRKLPPVIRSGTNPGDVGHQWVFERFIANREPYMVYEEQIEVEVERMGKLDLTTSKQFIPAKLADNPKMADRESYIAGLKEMGEDGEAYLSGDWSAFSGQMFTKKPRVGPPLAWTPGSIIIRALDYGFADPMCLMWGRRHANGLVEIIKELYGPGMTVDAIAHYVNLTEREMQLRPVLSVAGVDIFSKKDTGTGQGQSIATMLQQRGVWFEEANNERVAGWARVRSLISKDLLYVHDGRAPNLMRTLPNLVRDPNKPEDVKDKQEDHAAECLRYLLMALPEAGIVAGTGHVPAPQVVTEQDPTFKAIMAGMAQGARGNVNFPGLEG